MRAEPRPPVARALRAAFAVAAFAFAVPAAGETLDRIAAVVDDEIVTHRELDDAVRRLRRMLRERRTEPPSPKVLAAQALQELIIKKLQLQEAARRGVVVTEPQLDRAMEDLAKRNRMTLAELKVQVEKEGGSYAELREDLRAQMIIAQLRQREVTDKIEVTEQEIRDFLTERNVEFEYRFARVALALPGSETGLDRARAWFRSLRDTAAGGDFAEAFREMRRRVAPPEEDPEEDPEEGDEEQEERFDARFKDMGWRYTEELPRALANRAARMGVGAFSPLIKTAKALYLFRLEGKRDAGQPATVERQYHARHILMQTNAMDTDAVVRRRLARIKKRLQDGGDFARYAREYSQDPGSSFKGGELGWVSPQSMVPAFAEKLQSSAKDEIVGPFKSSFGWHLLQVSGVREHDVGNETWRRRAVAEIRRKKSDEEVRAWLLRLRERRYVDIRL